MVGLHQCMTTGGNLSEKRAGASDEAYTMSIMWRNQQSNSQQMKTLTPYGELSRTLASKRAKLMHGVIVRGELENVLFVWVGGCLSLSS